MTNAATATYRSATDKYVTYQRMAAAIVETIRKKDGCLPQDLLEKGFTHQETLDLWHMAQAMAEIELKLTVA